jgi:hypothetical protein
MIRTGAIPAYQDQRNTRVAKVVSMIGLAALGLIITPAGLMAWLYFNPRAEDVDRTAQVVGPDGRSGFAVVLTSTLVLVDANPGERQSIVFGGSDSIPSSLVRAERVTDAAFMALVRLGSPAPAGFVPVLGTSSGRGITRTAEGSWEGTLVDVPGSGLLDPQPAFTLGPGIPIYSPTEASLIGVSAATTSGIAVVPTRELLKRFPEISAGQ